MATYNILTNADMRFNPARDKKGKPLDVTHSTIGALISHDERKIRRRAWRNYADGYLTHKNTLTNTLVTAVKRDVFYARSRGYGSSLEASLAPNHIPVEVFHNLIEAFKKNLPTWHRYWKIRKKALGYKKLHEYDIKAPLAKNPPVVSYEQAVEWIAEGLLPMGKEYISVLRNGCLEERWVDAYPNKGKRTGAFSWGAPGTHPFIMMSYADSIFSLSTLAHELGHSMHSFLTWQNQPVLYADYSLFVAEVASNFHQAMLRDHLLKTNPERDFQIAVMEEAMANFYRYFFIMPTLARFELETHTRVEKDQPLTAESLIHLMADLFREAYGDTVHLNREYIGMTWARFGHLYTDYYVFQYATGISGAQALSNRVLRGEPGAVEDYLQFLKSGSSVYPLDLLKRAGVDLTGPEPVVEAFALMAAYIDRLEKLLK